jgi:hypothetical protein
MEEEEKKEKDNSDKFGKVIDILHNKQKLPSLRTYQGDMAEFIKEKNESVVSIAVKEKEKKEEKEEEEKKENFSQTAKPVLNKEGFQISFTILLSSLLLITGGVVASLYIFEFVNKEPSGGAVIEEEIIPYNNSVTLANITNQNLGPELNKLSLSNGINVVKISDISGQPLQKARDFFGFLKISLPFGLERTLKDKYAVGIISQNEKISPFLIITVDDFGGAFSAMLDWEGNMAKDLSFLNAEANIVAVASTTASTTVSVKIPMKQDFFSWKDIIVKNKDTRGLVNQKNQSKIAYTFLDKNTILITNNLSAIGDISSAHASRSVAR